MFSWEFATWVNYTIKNFFTVCKRISTLDEQGIIQDMKPYHLLIVFVLLVLMGCQNTPPIIQQPLPSPSLARTPYHSPAQTTTATPAAAPTFTPLPSPSPTPRTHTVRLNEDLFGISLAYGTTVEELRLLNPDVNPNAMRVGTVLILPPAKGQPTQRPLAPTPVALLSQQPVCQPDSGGGLWCFWLIENPFEQRVEAITATFQLRTAAEGRLQPSALLLDGIPPQSALPLAAYFSAPISQPYQISAELTSAVALQGNDTRHLPLVLEEVQWMAEPADPRSAAITCFMHLSEDAQSATSRIWLLAIAYDLNGQVTGLRRQEWSAPLQPGQTIPCQMTLYGLNAIANVQLFAEASP